MGTGWGRQGMPLRASVPRHLEITAFLLRTVSQFISKTRPQVFGDREDRSWTIHPRTSSHPQQAALCLLALYVLLNLSDSAHIQPPEELYVELCHWVSLARYPTLTAIQSATALQPSGLRM